tara:strand:+ start:419 stop:547 length:129 start_codon:yes stop_codon:yes gene_type:complete
MQVMGIAFGVDIFAETKPMVRRLDCGGIPFAIRRSEVAVSGP